MYSSCILSPTPITTLYTINVFWRLGLSSCHPSKKSINFVELLPCLWSFSISMYGTFLVTGQPPSKSLWPRVWWLNLWGKPFLAGASSQGCRTLWESGYSWDLSIWWFIPTGLVFFPGKTALVWDGIWVVGLLLSRILYCGRLVLCLEEHLAASLATLL